VGRGHKLVLSLSWQSEETLSLKEIIESRKSLLQDSRELLEGSAIQHAKVEGELRRARFMLFDRSLILGDSERTVQDLHAHQIEVTKRMERNSLFLTDQHSMPSSHCDIALIDQVRATLLSDEASRDNLAVKMTIEDRTIAVSRQSVVECESSIFALELTLRQCENERSSAIQRILSLEDFLHSVEDQLVGMNDGSGVALNPQPIMADLVAANTTSCVLNACPVCSLWYSCNNFILTDCGHAYHSFCLANYAKRSLRCLLQSCELEFGLD
jgi:hypothetical protein